MSVCSFKDMLFSWDVIQNALSNNKNNLFLQELDVAQLHAVMNAGPFKQTPGQLITLV